MAAFLSGAWLAEATDRTRVLPPSPAGGDARIQFVAEGAGGTEWGLVIAGGVAASWTPGPLPDPEVEIRCQVDDAPALLAARSGTETTGRTTIVVERSTGTYVGAPPPLDMRANADRLPVLPAVDLRWQIMLQRGPFGFVEYGLVFEDGRLTALDLGPLEDADVVLEIPFVQAMRLRRREATILDALPHGRISGSEGALGLLAGLLESPAYVDIMRENGDGQGIVALCVLGEVAASSGYRHAMADLTGTG